jgi:hypothetical protein
MYNYYIQRFYANPDFVESIENITHRNMKLHQFTFFHFNLNFDFIFLFEN